MIPYGRQSIDKDDIRAVIDVLKSDWLTQGPKINSFEEALVKYCGARYAVVFANGTAALHGAYFVAGLKNGDEFITSPMTFAATANAGLYLGAKPVFADIDGDGNLDPLAAERKIGKRTKAISVVDYGGLPADLDAFRKITRKHGLVFIEDACHAIGAEYEGRKIGAIADLTVFSFHPVKNITTGEGGAVLTNNKKYYESLKLFRSHGITKEKTKLINKRNGEWHHEMQTLGFNYRMTDLQAALGMTQLKKLDKFIGARRLIAERYAVGLAPLDKFLELPHENKNSLSGWHLYPIRLRGEFAGKRSEVFRKLRAKGIGVQVHYIPVYRHPYYQGLDYKKGLCPKAEKFYEQEISLPIFPSLAIKNQNFVICALADILKDL